jgi:hypothetical protein
MSLPQVDSGTFQVIRTDGTTETMTFDKKARNRDVSVLDAIRKAIAADTLEFVRIGKVEGSDLIMAVDDNGYETQVVEHGPGEGHDFRIELWPIRALKPDNPKATDLYHAICIPGTTHRIVGDVAILHDGDFA